MSIRVKFLGIVAALVLLLGVGSALEVRAILQRELRATLETRGLALARDLAARSTDSILVDNRFSLYALVRATLENNPDVRYIFVSGPDRQVLVHTFARQVPPDLLRVNDVKGGRPYQVQVLASNEGRLTDIAVPILGGRVGTARVGFSHARLEQSIGAATLTLAGVMAVALLLSFGVALVFTHRLTRPVVELVDVARRVSQGDLSARAARVAGDEIGELARAFNGMTVNLARSREEIRQREARRVQLLSQVISAQEAERQRLARELHDEAGQSLTTLVLGLRTLEQHPDVPDGARQQVADLKELAKQLLDEIHHLAVGLRPHVLDQLGLVGAVGGLVHEFAERTGIQGDFEVSGLGQTRLSSEVETAVYRVVQEALANVRKHAGASRVGVLLERRDDSIVAVVEDDGRGFDVDGVLRAVHPSGDARLGLVGIRERVDLLNGHLTIESEPGKGTTLFVEMPITVGHDSHPLG